MDYIDIGVVNKLAEIVIRRHRLIEIVFRCGNGLFEMSAVDIAHCDKTTLRRTCEVIGRAAYAAYADNTLRELVARGNISVSAQHFTGNNGK